MTPELLGKRWPTMDLALSLLPEKAEIVETGCVRSPDDWSGAGMSTVVFGDWACKHDGRLSSVDIDEASIATALAVAKGPVTLHHRDSLDYLSWRVKPIDLLYLDSLDYPYGAMLDAYGGQTDLDAAVAELARIPEDAVVRQFDHLIAPSQEHCAREVRAGLPLLKQTGLVLIDDAGLPGGGKARLARKVLAEQGWHCILDEYQTLWAR